ncbi:MAG: TetR/AcrR family transcriptional regulator [Clostridiales bacterium]|nr:TetR/AcrR family transcriptional regulator [Clostridiales bacterium]
MAFERARSNEQKELRLKQIKDATMHLYNTVVYQDISMASIAKELDFTRGNLYKYYATKEEILLDVLSDKINVWHQNLVTAMTYIPVDDIKQFSRIWAEVTDESKDFLKLFSILFSIIERNVSIEKLTLFKKEILTSNMATANLIKEKFPNMSDENIMNFLSLQISTIVGLYPLSNPSELQQQAIKNSGYPYTSPCFLTTFKNFLETLLISYT